jgi:hypothetical protein
MYSKYSKKELTKKYIQEEKNKILKEFQKISEDIFKNILANITTKKTEKINFEEINTIYTTNQDSLEDIFLNIIEKFAKEENKLKIKQK